MYKFETLFQLWVARRFVFDDTGTGLKNG